MREKTFTIIFLSMICIGGSYLNNALGKNGFTLEDAKKALPNTPIREVNPSPISGLYEVIAGSNVLYMDETERYLLVGEIYNLKTSKNINDKLSKCKEIC